MQSQKYTVEVYEFPKYNGDEYIQPDHIMYTQIFTWGYHDLQNNIQSYKIHAPEMLIENTYLEDGIDYSPIITLVDNENNYYNFNDLEIEKLPERKYKIIIIQISHIPIRYDLKHDNDGNLIGTQVVEYYDNNGNKVNATDDYYSDVYQIKIEEIDVIALICDKKIPFETKEQYYFYSSVLYLPAYTQERTFIKRFEDYSMPDDVEAMLNNDPDTPLTFKFLHTFTPNKIYYYYEFYDKMLPTRELIDVLTLRYEDEVSELKGEIALSLSLSPERVIDKTELLNALLEQINEEHKLPKQQSQIYLNKIKEIKNRILERDSNGEYKAPEKPVFSVICTNMSTKLEYYARDLQTDIILQKECEVGYPYFQEGYGVRFNDNPHIYTIKDNVQDVPLKINRVNVFKLGDNNANENTTNLLDLDAEKERKRIEQIDAEEKEKERKEKERERTEQQEQEIKRIEEEEEARKIIEIEEERKNKESEEKRKKEIKEKEEVFWFNIKIGVIFVLSILLIFVIIKTRQQRSVLL